MLACVIIPSKENQKITTQDRNNVKVGRDAGEPNKPNRNNSKDKDDINLPKSNKYQRNAISADCGDPGTNKIELEQNNTKAAKDGLIKKNESNKSKLTLLTSNDKISFEKKRDVIISKINRIVKQNINLQNINANQTIDVKHDNNITKTTEGHKTDLRKQTEEKSSIKMDGRRRDKDSEVKSTCRDKTSNSVSHDRKDKKNPKMPLVVNIPKSDNHFDTQTCETHNNINNRKNVGQQNFLSDTDKRNAPKTSILSKYYKKTRNEPHFVLKNKRSKVQNYFRMYTWTRNDTAPDKNNCHQNTEQNIQLELNKKAIKLRSSTNYKKKESSHLSLRRKLQSKENSKIERCKLNDEKLSATPDSTSIRRTYSSPLTEVAKWAPNSKDKHIKLYYEAWVNNTLAAISKDKPGVPTNMPCRMKSPVLLHENYTDKKFVGIIKVNKKKKNIKKPLKII